PLANERVGIAEVHCEVARPVPRHGERVDDVRRRGECVVHRKWGAQLPAMIFCSRGFSIRRPPEPKSQPNGAWPLMRSPRARFTFIAERVRSRIMALSSSANTDAICAIARPYGLLMSKLSAMD